MAHAWREFARRNFFLQFILLVFAAAFSTGYKKRHVGLCDDIHSSLISSRTNHQGMATSSLKLRNKCYRAIISDAVDATALGLQV